jgi:hypothetical protein
MVVNKSLAGARTLSITLSRTALRIERFSPATGSWTKVTGNSRSFVLKRIPPGDAVLCRVVG